MIKADEEQVRAGYSELTRFLIDRKLTITTMESATSGQVASLITDTEGASAILKGAFVTYSNEAKIREGVPKEIIDTYSVYSKETAEAMAKACRAAYNADIGVGITGTMGNVDPANAGASVPGNVYYAVDYHGTVSVFHQTLPAQETRLAYKLLVAKLVLDSLSEILNM